MLKINEKDAFTEYGVRMGDDFLDVLGEPFPLKDYITNSNRLKNGVSYCVTIPKIDERQLTLSFTIEGSDHADYLSKKKAFFSILYAGDIKIQVTEDSDDIYHLKYTGKSVTYAQNIQKTFCVIKIKFVEPDPSNRV